MADSVGTQIIRILRRTLQNPAKTTPSDSDDTQLLMDLLNEAHLQIRELFPTTLDANQTFTVAINTRLTVNPVSGLDIYDIYDWSWQYTDASGKQNPLMWVTTEYIYTQFPNYGTDTAQYPYYAYMDNNQIGIYPFIGPTFNPLSINFKYPAMAMRAVNWTDTFPYPADWLLWMERYAQYFYETTKGLGNPTSTAAALDVIYGRIFGKVKRQQNIGFKGNRRPSRGRWGNSRLDSNVW